MKPSLSNPRTNHGNALVPVLIIAGALAVSALVFFFYTRPKMGAGADANAKNELQKPLLHDSTSKSGQPSAATGDASAAPLPRPGVLTPMPEPAIIGQMQQGFSKPGDLGSKLASALAAGDTATATKILSGGQASQEIAARSFLENLAKMGYKVAPDQVQLIGQVDGLQRLSIPLIDAKTNKPFGSSLILEVERDAKMGYKVARIRIPKELEMVLASQAPTGLPDAAPAAMPAAVVAPGAKPLVVVDQMPDALTVASAFVHSLLRLDYEAARKLVDEDKVPVVKLAALCIVFEDSKYQLMESHPLVSTVSSENASWIIAHIGSEILKEETEFGLEMELSEGKWRVGGLNLSKMLLDNAKSSSLVGIPYTPLLLNPKGGEFIALYFEYDQATLHPRAGRQLDIVASILKSASHKRLKISGHTDALGTDDYNIALSQHRAEAVKTYLLNHGVPPDQVETVGFGKAVPLSPNVRPDGSDNPDGRSHNRRAEILLDF